jgi:hypothetical protein
MALMTSKARQWPLTITLTYLVTIPFYILCIYTQSVAMIIPPLAVYPLAVLSSNVGLSKGEARNGEVGMKKDYLGTD